MKKNKEIKLVFSKIFYSTKNIKIAINNFEGLADFSLIKKDNNSEVSIKNYEEDNLAFEFANYVLFLNIQ